MVCSLGGEQPLCCLLLRSSLQSSPVAFVCRVWVVVHRPLRPDMPPGIGSWLHSATANLKRKGRLQWPVSATELWRHSQFYKQQCYTQQADLARWSAFSDDGSPVCTSYSLGCLRAGLAQSVERLATGWTVRGSNPGSGEIFRTRPDRPWGPPRPYTMGAGSIPRG